MKITITSLLVISALSGVTAHAAKQNNMEPNIVGGIETPAYSRPYQVALLMNGRQGCGGTLLSRDWVLTAAHCLDSASTSNLTVRVGAHSIAQNDGQTLRVSQIISHEQWRGANGIRSGYDIAVLRLATPADSKYTPAKLPTRDIENAHANVGDTVTVSGWGLTSNRGRPSDRLREVGLPVISNSSCSSQLNYTIPGSVICGGGQGGRSACNGDSGGPYAVRVGNDYYSIGTVSWGIACSGATAFTRTTSYLNWIESKTGIGTTDPIDTPPVADFSYEANKLDVAFTSRSTDDKAIQSYYWQFGDSQQGTSTAQNPSYQFAEAGTYTVRLTVTDTAQQTRTTSQSVQVSDSTSPGCDGLAAWDASTSYALGDEVSYLGFKYEATWWSQGAQPNLFSNVWRKGNACSNTSDPLPKADFSTSINGLTIQFSNSSTDNGRITRTVWRFGDGSTSTLNSPSHTYAQNGSYQVTLEVTDDQGQTNQISKSVSVSKGGSGNCNGVQPWSATQVYLTGDLATVGNTIYRANWWVQGENPEDAGPWGAWTAVGNCQ